MGSDMEMKFEMMATPAMEMGAAVTEEQLSLAIYVPEGRRLHLILVFPVLLDTIRQVRQLLIHEFRPEETVLELGLKYEMMVTLMMGMVVAVTAFLLIQIIFVQEEAQLQLILDLNVGLDL
jgi:hypothetical protein